MNQKANNANARHAGMRRYTENVQDPAHQLDGEEDGDETPNQTQQIARQTPKSFCSTRYQNGAEPGKPWTAIQWNQINQINHTNLNKHVHYVNKTMRLALIKHY